MQPTKIDLSRKYNATKMPDFKGLKAFILPGAFYSSCVGLMAEAGFQKAKSYDEADVVVFIGGEDINPKMYGEAAHPTTYFTEVRDHVEQLHYNRCVADKKVMFGICRGAQFLHAMNGGKLWQNVNNHAGGDHFIYDIDADCYVEATSIHHQMLRMSDDVDVVAICGSQIATSFEDGAGTKVKVDPTNIEQFELEIEAGAYKDTQCFFVQGHPEIGSAEYRSWTMHRLFDFMMAWGADQTAGDEFDVLPRASIAI